MEKLKLIPFNIFLLVLIPYGGGGGYIYSISYFFFLFQSKVRNILIRGQSQSLHRKDLEYTDPEHICYS